MKLFRNVSIFVSLYGLAAMILTLAFIQILKDDIISGTLVPSFKWDWRVDSSQMTEEAKNYDEREVQLLSSAGVWVFLWNFFCLYSLINLTFGYLTLCTHSVYQSFKLRNLVENYTSQRCVNWSINKTSAHFQLSQSALTSNNLSQMSTTIRLRTASVNLMLFDFF